jgi:hypothetical protein
MNVLVIINSFKKLKEIAESYWVRDVTIEYYKEQMKSWYRFINLTELSRWTLRTYSNKNGTQIYKLKPFIILWKVLC